MKEHQRASRVRERVPDGLPQALLRANCRLGHLPGPYPGRHVGSVLQKVVDNGNSPMCLAGCSPRRQFARPQTVSGQWGLFPPSLNHARTLCIVLACLEPHSHSIAPPSPGQIGSSTSPPGRYRLPTCVFLRSYFFLGSLQPHELRKAPYA